ncbi:AzlD domain-containing protein [Rhodococcoides kyotonense]|uniref:Branched-chain amino acid transport protein (AzlD) n=1 Tax=Rhodococcoides kyotonense TaxID=398843 RepID=A0A239L7K6_9NOCA|nr:AzlD domain-containing protein [Rhodococcus kyotonensis]SNT25982.1 Branched-chain amino acid transport protein (AzlD) [Rhodococcus kyotonensis]
MSVLIPMIALAVGTLAFRIVGPMVRSRITVPARVEEISSMSVAVIFVALVATSALVVDKQFAGFALPIGVLVAAVLAWRKAPFVAVVIAAAATTATLRWLGVA